MGRQGLKRLYAEMNMRKGLFQGKKIIIQLYVNLNGKFCTKYVEAVWDTLVTVEGNGELKSKK